MYRHLVALAAGGVIYTSAAMSLFDQDNPPGPHGPAAAEPGDHDKIICRTARPPTGTRVRSARSRNTVCMTKADWELQDREAQDAARTVARNSNNTEPSENKPPPK